MLVSASMVFCVSGRLRCVSISSTVQPDSFARLAPVLLAGLVALAEIDRRHGLAEEVPVLRKVVPGQGRQPSADSEEETTQR